MNRTNWIDRIGNWNPQLAREIQGRFKPKPIFLSILLSLLGQFTIILIIVDFEYSTSLLFSVKIINYLVLVLLLVGGVYAIVNDMATEQFKGTLNFIRSSPQSSQRILLGKILGVPSLLYLNVALCIPLHFLLAILADALVMVLRYYLIVAASCALFYTAAVLSALLFEKYASWLANVISIALSLPYALLVNVVLSNNSHVGFSLNWFTIALEQNFELDQLFIFGNCLLWSYWLWRVLNRRFRNPNASLLTKRESYWLTASFELVLLGFFFSDIASFGSQSSHYFLQQSLGNIASFGSQSSHDLLQQSLSSTAFWNLGFFIVLTASLFPSNQSLQDWARYKHINRSQQDRDRFRHFSLARELILGEKSPASIAIAINLAITALIWMPWLIIAASTNSKFWYICIAPWFSANLILIYTAIAHLIFLSGAKKRVLWISLSLLALTILPPLTMFAISGDIVNKFWIFHVFSGAFFVLKDTSAIAIGINLLSQLAVISLLSLKLSQRLHQLGKSQSKILMESPSDLSR